MLLTHKVKTTTHVEWEKTSLSNTYLLICNLQLNICIRWLKTVLLSYAKYRTLSTVGIWNIWIMNFYLASIHIVVRYSDHHSNIGQVFKWWAEYQSKFSLVFKWYLNVCMLTLRSWWSWILILFYWQRTHWIFQQITFSLWITDHSAIGQLLTIQIPD